MVPNIFFGACLYIASVSGQIPTASDKGPSSSDIMSNIFAWADAVRPIDSVDSQSASVSDTGLPPEPALPDINAGIPAGSALGLPAKDKFPPEVDTLRDQSASVSDIGLPLEPALPDINAGFPSGSDFGFPAGPKVPVIDSVLSGQVLPVEKPPKHPSKPNPGVLDLPPHVQIKDTVPGSTGPNKVLPNQKSLFPDIPSPDQGLPQEINLDADIVDPNLLFPAETANAPNPNVGNNKLMLNFMPFFPKGKKVVNLNNGQTLNSPSDIGALPDPSIAESRASGIPAEKSPTKIDFSPFFPIGERVINLNSGETLNSPSDIAVLPDPNVVDRIRSGFPPKAIPPKPDLSVVSPFVADGNQPLVRPPFNNVQVKASPDKPLLPAGTIVDPMSGSQFIPTDSQFKPLEPNVLIETQPQQPDLPLGPPAESLLPFMPPRRHIDPPGRPISMLPVATIEAAKKPENLPVDTGVQPDIFGLPDSLVPTDARLLTDITNQGQGQDIPPTGSQNFLPSAGRGFGFARDPNKMPSNWLNLYPNGRPKKLQNVKTGEVQDIAPPTADEAILSTISLTSFGKDKAMRRMLREQRRQARKNKRQQRQQQRQRGRGATPNRRNAQNQRIMQNRRNPPSQGNMSNPRNRGRGRNQNRNIHRGPVMGRRGGEKKLRRSKRQAFMTDGQIQQGNERKATKRRKGNRKQKKGRKKAQRKIKDMPTGQGPQVNMADQGFQSQGDGSVHGIDVHGHGSASSIDVYGHGSASDVDVHGHSRAPGVDVHGHGRAPGIDVQGHGSAQGIDAHRHGSASGFDVLGQSSGLGVDMHGHGSASGVDMHSHGIAQGVDVHGHGSASSVDVHGHGSVPGVDMHGHGSAPGVDTHGHSRVPGVDMHGKGSAPRVYLQGHGKVSGVDEHGHSIGQGIDVHGHGSASDVDIQGHIGSQGFDLHGHGNAQGVDVHGHGSTSGIDVQGQGSASSIDVHGHGSVPGVDVNGYGTAPDVDVRGHGSAAGVGAHGHGSAPNVDVHSHGSARGIDVHVQGSVPGIELHGHGTMQGVDIHGHNSAPGLDGHGHDIHFETSLLGDVPGSSYPDRRVSDGAFLGGTQIEGSFPDVDLTGGTLHESSLPGVALPGSSLADGIMPGDVLPGISLPDWNLPVDALPPPSDKLSDVALPSDSAPSSALTVDNAPSGSLSGSLPELPVTDQIKQEASKHVMKPGLPWLKSRKWARGRWRNMGPKKGMTKHFAKGNTPTEGVTALDGRVADLAVTEQIKHEAAKNVGHLAFPGNRGQRQNKLKRFRNVRKDGIHVSDSSFVDLPVTEQIKHEVAKDVGHLAFPGNLRKRQNIQKKFRNVRNDAIHVSDGGGEDLAVTEQIRKEAAKHVGALAFPRNELRKARRLQKWKLRKQRRLGNNPVDGERVAHVNNEGLPVTDQIKQEAAKHVGDRVSPRKFRGRGRQRLQGPFRLGKIPNSGKQSVNFRPGVADNFGSGRSIMNLQNFRGGMQNRRPAKKVGKRKTFIQRMRAGRRPKTRVTRKFVDVSMVGNAAGRDTATID